VSFRDRSEAGRELAAKLLHLRDRDPVVLALPRGGVPVALEVARALAAPLDVVLVRKLGAPGQPELAMAAVVDGGQREIVRNEDIVSALGVDEDAIREAADRQVAEIERRRRLYVGGRPPVPVEGRTAIVVDDGIATGASMRAALRGVRRRRPAHLVLAVPVAPPQTVEELRREVDELVCLDAPPGFAAVGQFYDRFAQVEDDEVREMLEAAGATA